MIFYNIDTIRILCDRRKNRWLKAKAKTKERKRKARRNKGNQFISTSLISSKNPKEKRNRLLGFFLLFLHGEIYPFAKVLLLTSCPFVPYVANLEFHLMHSG